jgi:DnaJ-class molecular chaperone
VLGLKRGASLQEIKAAYREKVRHSCVDVFAEIPQPEERVEIS